MVGKIMKRLAIGQLKTLRLRTSPVCLMRHSKNDEIVICRKLIYNLGTKNVVGAE